MTVYQWLALWRDLVAVQRGRIGERLWNRAVGRVLGRIARRLYR